jgi:hypothetical protein
VTAHVLRHSFASVADELGYTEATVAALLGQRSGNVTRRYIHQLDRALIAAADKVSANISAAITGRESTGENVTPTQSSAAERDTYEAKAGALREQPVR